MNVKKVATWAIVIFLAYYLLTKPTGAAAAIHNLLNLLKQAGGSMATFLSNL